MAIDLAHAGAAAVHAIDVSIVALRSGAAAAGANRAAVTFELMDGEELAYSNDSFDLIYGRSILHHLSLTKALPEIRRVLRPEGRAIFLEPLAHNPVLRLSRWLTPRLRSPDERPLRVGDFALLRRYFTAVHAEYFHLATLAALPFRRFPGVPKAIGWLDHLDRLLFATPLRRYAWVVVLTLAGRRSERSNEGLAGRAGLAGSGVHGTR